MYYSDTPYTKDLSKKRYSATSVFIQILPKVKNIKTLTNDKDEQLYMAKDLIIANLMTARECSPHSISLDYINSYRHRIDTCADLDEIIKMLCRSINAGKNYLK